MLAQPSNPERAASKTNPAMATGFCFMLETRCCPDDRRYAAAAEGRGSSENPVSIDHLRSKPAQTIAPTALPC